MAEIAETKPIEGFALDGFRGMRRVAINQFAKKFFITGDNPNGTIDPFPEDMEKEKLDSLMELYMGQGKFSADPFNLRPQDEIAEMKKQIADLQEMLKGPQANPETAGYKPPQTGHVHESSGHVLEPTTVRTPDSTLDVAHEDMPWAAIVAKAKGMGIKTWKKTRTVVISEIEAKEAE